jgi:hypothetical protein
MRPTETRLGGVASDRFLPGVFMRKSLTLLGALFLSAIVAAGPKPQSGNILSHTSVTCGAKKSKKQDIDLLCQQYVVRSGTTDYTIRQPKQRNFRFETKLQQQFRKGRTR